MAMYARYLVSICFTFCLLALTPLPARADPGAAITDGLRAMRAGNYARAETAFAAAIADDKSTRLQRARAYGYRGSARLRLRRHKDALSDLNRALELDRSSAWALSERCWAHRGLGQPKRAIDDANRAMMARRNLLNAFRCRARVYFDQAQYDLAAQDLSEVIQSKRLPRSSRARAYRDRGDARYRLGEYETAAADFERALELEPDHAGAHTARCRALALAGQPKLGLEHCERALDLQPDSLVALDSQGLAQFRAGSFGAAIRTFSTLLKREPEAWYALYHRAMAYEATGNDAAAARDFDAALAAAPSKADFDKKVFRMKAFRKGGS